jgi:hypothetical protein
MAVASHPVGGVPRLATPLLLLDGKLAQLFKRVWLHPRCFEHAADKTGLATTVPQADRGCSIRDVRLPALLLLP